MNKPNDIPDDVWETALTMPLGDTGDMETDITIPIARAIMAERERCIGRSEAMRDHFAADQKAAIDRKDKWQARDFESMKLGAASAAIAIRGEA